MATRCARHLSARSPAPLPKNVRGGIDGLVVPRLKSSLAFDPSAGTVAQHPKRRALGQSLGVVSVLVACQAAVERLAEEVRERKLPIASGARVNEVPFDQRDQAGALIQLAREQQPSLGGNRGSAELDAKLGIERETNRARFRVTHWVVPSAPARSCREPQFLGALS